ncbi:Ras GTPase ras2 [Pseudogymnoascus verrucosus]|uniref:Ras GTPase ras2 n=1 Tax=Pseudogymnoascus verrucosus TaxID=342668 RepID=A0A1B8GFH4_9PEZI|nr:Ras GTPase ras2 [Pseudogymnoascus verrucosus]OBT94589.1 Ras GTPase ras2 [Pseudogymnoascus verrucosus]
MAGLSLRTIPKVSKIIVVGEKGVGKTKIIDQFILNTFIEDHDGLIWTNYRKQIVLDDRVAFLDVSDTITPTDAEMEQYLRAGWEHQIRHADAALLVYSITSRESFVRVTALRDEMLGVPAEMGEDGGGGEVVGEARVRPIQIGLVGNKSDRSADREVSVNEGVELAKSLGCGFVETSAKEGYNIDKAFHDLVRAIDRGQGNEKQCKDQGSAAAVGGFRGRLGRLARSLRLKKN